MRMRCLLLSLGIGVGVSMMAPAADYSSQASGDWRGTEQYNTTPPPELWWMRVWHTTVGLFPGSTDSALINSGHTVSLPGTESVAKLSLLGTLNLQDHSFINLSTGLVNGATILGGISTGHFENDGMMAAEGNLHMNDTPFENEVGALFDLRNDCAITAYGGTYGRGAFINYGTFRKSGGSGSSRLCQGNNVGFQNIGGTIEVQSGTLDIGGVRASSSGTFNVSSNAVLDLGGSDNPRYNGTYTGSGAGIVCHENTGITITLGTDGQPVTFNFPSHYFRWRAGGILASSPLVNADWLTFEGGDEKTLSGSISNLGVIAHTDTGNLHMNEAVVMNAPGAVYDFRSDADITAYFTGSGTAQFRNFGVLRKSGGTEVSSLQRFRNLGGTIEVRSGTLALRENGAGASVDAFFAVSNGATVDLTYNESGHYNGRYTGHGDGMVQLTNGILYASETVLAFTNDLFHWQGGALAGSASNIARVATEGTSTKTLNGDFSNYGSWNHRGSGNFYLNETVFINQPDGLFDIQEDGQMTQYSGGTGRTVFRNYGTLRKSGGAETFTVRRIQNLGGAIEVQSGRLALREEGASAGSSSGFLNVASNAVLDLTDGQGGRYYGTWTGAGAGTVLLFNGTMSVSGTCLNFTNDLFHWQGGILAGSASNVAWVATEGASIKTVNGDFSNYGSWNHRGSGNFHLNETVFINQPGGFFDIQEDGQMTHYSGGTGRTKFDNRGTFRKSGGSGTFTVVRFHNPGGAVEALKGTLHFSEGYDQSAGSTRLAGGALSAGGTIAINGGTLSGTGTISATVSSSGTVAPGDSAGMLRIDGPYIQNAGGTLDIGIGGTAPDAQYDRLAVSGSANLNGILRVSLTNGFVPFFYDSFTILTRGSGAGSFSSLQLPALPTGLQWRVSTLSTAVVLDVVGSVQFATNAYHVAENGTSVTVTVNRQAGSTGSVSAAFATANGSAKAGSDYTATNGILTWASDDLAPRSFAILVADDAVWESNETFTVRLTGPAVGPESNATVTIVENEAPVPPRRINCGGKPVGIWAGDSGCILGSAVTSNVKVANAQGVPLTVYKNYRRGPTISFKYKTVPNGQYRVNLHFAEHQFQAVGKRVFNVSLNGKPVLTNFDVFKKAGGWRRALVRSFTVTITNGKGLTIVGTGVGGSSAILNGIEIIPLLDAEAGKYDSSPKRGTRTGGLISTCVTITPDKQSPGTPRVWASSEIGDAYPAENVLDNDAETSWIGAPDEAPWSLTLDLGKVTALNRLDILFGEPAWTNWSLVGGRCLDQWFDLGGFTNSPVEVRYLFLTFRANPDQASPPVVQEIRWEE